MAGTGTVMVKVVLYGSMSSAQSWSTGFYVACPGLTTPPSATQLNDIAGAAEAAAASWWTALHAYQAPYCSLDGVRCYSYASGSNTSTAVGEYPAAAGTDGLGSHPIPPYVSLVVSLRTAISSRSTRGRMYVPLTDGGYFDGSGQATSSLCNALRVATTNLMNAVVGDVNSTLTGATAEVVVASFTDAKVTPVTQLIVDSLPDVQHRRTDKVGADYVSSGPYPGT